MSLCRNPRFFKTQKQPITDIFRLKEYLKMNKQTLLYIVRHGQTEWNSKKKIQGQKNIPLSITGIKQAELLGDLLIPVQFEKAVSSDLIRAKTTADIILKSRNIPVETTKNLRERKFGLHEGKPTKLIPELIRLINSDTTTPTDPINADANPETDSDILKRVLPHIRTIALDNPGKTILIVTHAGIIHILLRYFGIIASVQLKKRGIVKNTGYMVVGFNGKDFSVQDMKGIQIN
jgi:broad specificity phosphatase PhoE